MLKDREQKILNYMKEEITWEPVKKEIGLALKMGKDVPGAELVTKQNLQIK